VGADRWRDQPCAAVRAGRQFFTTCRRGGKRAGAHAPATAVLAGRECGGVGAGILACACVCARATGWLLRGATIQEVASTGTNPPDSP
jgi:hypothetical protein